MRQITLLLLGIFLVLPSFGQIAGETSESTTSLRYQSTYGNVTLDPTPKIGSATRKQLVHTINPGTGKTALGDEIGWQRLMQLIPYSSFSSDAWNVLNGVGKVADVGIYPVFNIGGSGDFGAYFQVNDIGTADIDVNYPIDVKVIYPKANTFACGQEFVIRTEWSVREEPGMLQVKPPFMELEVGPIIENVKVEADISLRVSACIGGKLPKVGCVGYRINHTAHFANPSYTFSIPALPPLLNVCENAFGAGKTDYDLVNCASSAGASLLYLAKVGNAGRNRNFSTITENKIIVALPSTPKVKLPEMDAEFNRIQASSLSYQNLNGGKSLRAYGTVQKTSKVRFDLVSLLKYKGVPVSKGLGPLGGYDIGDIAPNLKTHQKMDYRFDPRVKLELDLGVPMQYEVHDANYGMVSSSYGQIVRLLAGQWIKAVYPQHLSDPSQVNTTSELDANFSTKSEQQYYMAIDFSFLELKVLDYEKTLYETILYETQLPGSPDVLQDHTIRLENFGEKSLQGFALDPENPVIKVDHFAVVDVRNIGSGERLVVYRADIRNGGDVRLSDLALNFDVDSVYHSAKAFRVACVNSNTLSTNGAFDGIGDINLLAPNNSLEVGATATVEVLVWVKPEISAIDANGCFETVDYQGFTEAFGTSPIGTRVQSNVYQCTGERLEDDIIASVDLGAALQDQLEDFTVYGDHSVTFNQTGTLSKGHLGTSGKLFFHNATKGYGDTLVIFGDIHAGQTIYVQGDSKVEADYAQTTTYVQQASPSASLNMTGSLSEQSACVGTQSVYALSIPPNLSKQKVLVGKGVKRTLAPGDYNELRLQKAAELTLVSGVYNIKRWIFNGSDVQVNYDVSNGPITINMDQWLPLGQPNLRLEVLGDGAISDVSYRYAGNSPARFSNSLIQGHILAPLAQISFEDCSELQGKCYADQIFFNTNAHYTDPYYLQALEIDPSCQPTEVLAQCVAPKSTTGGSGGNSDNETNSQYRANELGGDGDLGVYPNPANDQVVIESTLPISKVQLVTAQGVVILEVETITQRMVLQLPELSAGLYYLQVETERGLQVRKLFKE